MTDATDQVSRALGEGIFKSVIVTSRQPAPTGWVWETVKTVVAHPLTPEQVPAYVERTSAWRDQTPLAYRVEPYWAPKFEALGDQVKSTTMHRFDLREDREELVGHHSALQHEFPRMAGNSLHDAANSLLGLINSLFGAN